MDEELRILNRIDLPAALDALDDRIMGALAPSTLLGVQ